MVLSPCWCSLFLAFLAGASASSVLKDALSGIPSGWTELQDAELSPTRGLKLRFGLTQHDFPQLESLLLDISDPSHPSYGNHLSRDEVHALSTPTEEAVQLVSDWLSANDAKSVKWTPSKDSVTAVVSVSSAESMFSTRFGVFEHGPTGERVVRTLSYSLPEELAPHVDFVHPTTAFLTPRRRESSPAAEANGVHLEKRPVVLNQSDFTSCVSVADPPCIRRLYNIGDYKPKIIDEKKNHIGVSGYLNIWAKPESLKLYLNDYIPESIGSNYTMGIVNITGPFDASPVSDEGNLDTQLAIQVAYPIPMTYYTTNTVPPYIPDQNQDGEMPGTNEPYLDFINYILTLEHPPTVITTSYGDDEQTVPRDYANAVCKGFAKLGARGVTVMFSTGDQGLGVDEVDSCIANTGNNATTFLPVFPASCPYVTSVGETFGFFPTEPSFASGAGFSYYFDQPAYQAAAVTGYLNGPAHRNETAMQSSMYNHKGRAYPDITCIGSGAFFDYYYNRWDISGGTSAAVPTAAGIVALLNDWRLQHGKSTLGFLNPFLYGAGLKGMVDITEGDVRGCEQPGFNATKGWDPTSGLGFFDFKKLQPLVLLA
ncbi:Tripeptidyl peptidase A [Favolaschia claudopus]|uniref:tripeptidyl-peptidase II n=1 Tax=Favolaschia claudopus TaxID=2862362 RepID=A0AAW0DYP3_9AGAR